MPLVDYASSDEGSDSEFQVDEKKEIQNEENQLHSSLENSLVNDNFNKHSNEELFSSLPKPRKSFSFFEDDNKLSKLLLNKDKSSLGKKGVKIYVPSVSEFENNTKEPPSKKVKPSVKGAGLFSVLPPPKNTSVNVSNLVPQSVSKNSLKNNVNKQEAFSKYVKKTSVKEAGAEEDDDDDCSVGNSFFGSSLIERNDSNSDYRNCENILKKETLSNVVPGIPEINMQEQKSNLGLINNTDEENHNCANEHLHTLEGVSASDNPLKLDEKALQILCGNKKKRQQMPMNIIDLSSEEVLPDSKEWLLKQFTEEKRGRSHSHKKNQGPSSQSRRKHQITYLAYQAKEQELELQNQWANNRMSRKQTQSKYGF